MGEAGGVLECAEWEKRWPSIPSVKGECAICHKALAYEKANEPFVQKRKLVLMCIPCAQGFAKYLEQRWGEKPFRSLLHNGQVTPTDRRN